MGNNQDSLSMKVNLSEIPWIKCNEGNMVWESAMIFKRIPALLSPSGKEELVPGEVIICKKCGKVPRFFWEKAQNIPEELKSYCGEGKETEE